MIKHTYIHTHTHTNTEKGDDEGDALPFFYPKPASSGPLPDVHLKPVKLLNLTPEDKWKRPSRELMRSIDVDHRLRHDFDGRSEMFGDRGGAQAVEPGSILLVEQVSCRSSPRKMAFAGVLLSITRKGIMSSITLRNYVLGTGVEMVFPIYSPMVTRIKVLKRVQEGFAKGRDDVFELRERPALAPFGFGEIEGMVKKDADYERKLAAARKQ